MHQSIQTKAALGIESLNQDDVFKAEITKSYWSTTRKGNKNYHIQLRGTCRENQVVNLFHKLYVSEKAVHHANHWLKPFGVQDVNELEDGDLVGHEITGKVIYRGLFHAVEVLSIDQRPPIQAPWHQKYADHVEAWRYAVEPPENAYVVKVEDVLPLTPKHNRVQVGSRLVCRIDRGPYEGNVVRIDAYEQETIDGQTYSTTPMDSLLDVLKFNDPKDIRKMNLEGVKLMVHLKWPLDTHDLGISRDSRFIDLIPEDEDPVQPLMAIHDPSVSEKDRHTQSRISYDFN